jgi:DNA-binding response OmpR family regulator
MVRNVRVRLSDDPAEAAELFRNVNGLGYMLVDHSRPIELIPDRDKQISFQVTIDSNRADVLERTLQDAGVAVRRLEPGVQLYLDNLQLPTKHINYPPIEEPDTLQNIHNRHFTFDPNTGEVTIGDRVVSLTTLEARTLYLIANSTVPVHISKICQYVGNGELVYDDQYARMMISKLRKKLGLSGSSDPIETISGKGLYRIRE